ncbi:receptor-type guanylate cyclase Gyc76C-like [Galendromus occidentalis]|uniref:Guanylate cyclase n=1 Tax=Galendromus occidentalis TaxID=34638 RepID=A0AAJ7SIA7_9ACAR|nr:receptor-type guanylate cyclase Gyc76C-like [Galendromus occidentalis]
MKAAEYHEIDQKEASLFPTIEWDILSIKVTDACDKRLNLLRMHSLVRAVASPFRGMCNLGNEDAKRIRNLTKRDCASAVLTLQHASREGLHFVNRKSFDSDDSFTPLYNVVGYNVPPQLVIDALDEYSFLQRHVDFGCFVSVDRAERLNEALVTSIDVICCQALFIYDMMSLDSDVIQQSLIESLVVKASGYKFGVFILSRSAKRVCSMCGVARSVIAGYDFTFDAPERLEISFVNCTPHFIVGLENSTGVTRYFPLHGTETWLLNDSATYLNFSYRLTENREKVWGSLSGKGRNRSWNGMVGDVFARTVDLAVTEISNTYARSQAIQYTRMFVWEKSLFVSKKGSQIPSASALWWPLDRLSWFLTLASLIFYSLAAAALVRFYDKTSIPQLSRDNIVLPKFRKLPPADFFMLVSTLARQSHLGYREYETLSYKVFMTWWWIFVLIMTNVYSSLILSFMSVPVFQPGVDTFDELLREMKAGRMTAGAQKTSFGSAILQTYDKPVAEYIEANFFGPEWFPEERAKGVSMAADDSINYAFVDMQNFVTAIIRANNWQHKLQLSKSYFSVTGSSWVLQKRCFMLSHFNDFIRREMEGGLIALYLDRALAAGSQGKKIVKVAEAIDFSDVFSHYCLIGYIAQFIGERGGTKLGLKISGALSYAAEKINNSTELLGDDKVEIIYKDERGDPIRATRLVVDMYNANVSMIVGPENFCKYEAHVATAVRLPIFSYKCNDPTIRLKETNLISLVPSEKYVVNMLIKLFERFNWRKFTLVYEDGNMRPIRTQLRHFVDSHPELKYVMREEVYASPGSHGCDPLTKRCGNHVMAEIIRSTKDGTRIYVMIGNISNLSSFGFTLAAMGLTQKNEYKIIYISTEFFIDDVNELLQYGASPFTPWYKYGQNIGMNHVLAIVPRAPKGVIKNDQFENIVREHNQSPTFKLSSPPNLGKKKISIFAYYLYDSLMTWAQAVTEIRKQKKDWADGAVVAQHIRNTTVIPSLTGINLTLEKDGHVVGEYELLSLDYPEDPRSKVGRFSVIGRFSVHNETVNLTLKVDPFGGAVILDEPLCGFDGAKCPSEKEFIRKITAGILLAVFAALSSGISLLYRYWEYEQEISGLLWKLDRSELNPYKGGNISAFSKLSIVSQASGNSFAFTPTNNLEICLYQRTRVVVKTLQLSRKTAGDIPRDMKKEMKMMRRMRNPNVNPFIGAYMAGPNQIRICSEHAHKGSLQDVLEDEEVFKLDHMFIASIVTDLVKGIEYIHQCPLKVHGNLKSTNCLITSKWTLQLSDFGLVACRYNTEDPSDTIQYFKGQLWRSPQILRARRTKGFAHPTQRDDIYSFAIIMHEIMSRKGVWGSIGLTPEEIVDRVCQILPEGKDPIRPPIDDMQCQDYVLKVVTDSWHESPEERPDITSIATNLKGIRQGLNDNLVDNMVTRLEKYANNLEGLVQDRTKKLEDEKKRTERLLHQILPESVAFQLIAGNYVDPESFEAVTIYFSDIVGFTDMSSTSTPMEVVDFLNDLYTLFDSIIRNYNVYKVETIGDAYMVVSGLPERNGDDHASEIALMALELLDAIKTFKIRHRPEQQLKLRIGLHTGPVVAGVVGLTMPRYCLFGDTVNTASRMESTGEALKVHVSSKTRELLDSIGGFDLACRGYVEMKGKGAQLTYWLTGHRDGTPKRLEGPLPPVKPLYNGLVREGQESRRASLIPLGDSTRARTAELLPNGGVKSRLPHNNSLITKRPSQTKLQQPKHSATPPFFINIGEVTNEDHPGTSAEEDDAGIVFSARETTVSFDTNGPTKIRRNGSTLSRGNDDSMAPLLPRPVRRAKLDGNLAQRCHSLDNELASGVPGENRTGENRAGESKPSGSGTGSRIKSAVQELLNLNNNGGHGDRESIV